MFDRMIDKWESGNYYENDDYLDKPWYLTTPRRQTEYAAAAMLQLAVSTNGLLALVSCGACETLVDLMLRSKVSSVHGCVYPEIRFMCIREKWTDDCDCNEQSCYFHRWYVCAALALEGCASGAIRLNHAGWNGNWHAVVKRDKTVKDEVVSKLNDRVLMVPTIDLHLMQQSYRQPECICNNDKQSLCPLEEPAFLEFFQTSPGDDEAADEDDEMASNLPSSSLE
jgi:hypothetical protein